MDPDRHLPVPGRKHPLPMVSPSATDHQGRPIAPSSTTYQPSLPSIRQLHPYLPPSGATQAHPTTHDSPSYGYGPLGAYPGSSGPTDPQPMPQGGVYSRSEGLESEPEADTEQPGPAKKKRRRQALSCNECKRRKIKCDRAQPCGPCTRRGEQSKCQWRTLEPVDKWITRAEYDELKSRTKAEYDQLKARIDHLEAMVARLFPAPPAAVNVPVYSMSPDMSGAPLPENMAYHAGHASTGPSHYTAAAVPSSSSYQPEHTSKPPQYSPHLVTSGSLPAPTPTQPPGGGSGGTPGHVRRTSTSDSKSPTTVRQSPLSLASITTPYNTDAQPKNCHAQTFTMPGVRLRPVLQDASKGLATTPRFCDIRPPRRITHARRRRRRPASQTLPWKDQLGLPWGTIFPGHRHGGDTAIWA